MLKLIFDGIRIENKRKFRFFAALYIVTFTVYCILCISRAVVTFTMGDISHYLLLLPNMSYAVYHGPLIAVIYVPVSFFEILFIVWQTNLKEQRLNRFILFFMTINIALAVIGITLKDGIGTVITALLVLALLIVIPTFIVFRIKKKNGTLDVSDIMTSEECEKNGDKK